MNIKKVVIDLPEELYNELDNQYHKDVGHIFFNNRLKKEITKSEYMIKIIKFFLKNVQE